MTRNGSAPEHIQEEIAATRRELGDTIAAVAYRADPKLQAQLKADEMKRTIRSRTPASVGSAAQQAQGHPLPLMIAGALAIGFVAGRARGRRAHG